MKAAQEVVKAHAAPKPTEGNGPCDSALAKQIPGAMFLVRCPDIHEWSRRCQELSISKLFEDEEVKDFFGSDPSKKIDQAMLQLQSAIPNLPRELVTQVIDLAHNGFKGEIAAAISAPVRRTAGGYREPEIYVSAELADVTDKFDSTMNSVVGFVRSIKGESSARKVAEDSMSYYEFRNVESENQGDAEGVRIGRRGHHIFLGGPHTEAIERLMGPAPEKSLSDNPSFQEACELFTKRPGSMYIYMDGPTLIESTQAKIEELAPFGFDRLKWIGFSFEPDGECMRHRLEVRADANPNVVALFTEKEKFNLAEELPASTIFVAQMALNGETTSQAIRKLISQFGTRAENNADRYDRQMKRMRQQHGTDADEVLGLLGDEAAIGVVSPDAGIIPDIYLMIRGKSAEAAARLGTIIETVARHAEPKNGFSTTQYKNHAIVTTQADEGPSPAMVVQGDLVVISSTLFSLKRWINFHEDAGAARLGSSKNYTQSLDTFGHEPATAYVWADWGAITKFAYGNIAQFAPMLASAVGKRTQKRAAHDLQSKPSDKTEIAPGIEVDWSKMPSVETIVRYITPQIIRFRVNAHGLSVESRAIL